MQKTQLKNYIEYLKSQPKGFTYESAEEKLLEIKKSCTNCSHCPLANQGRSKVVFGIGNPSAELMFVGEGPGRDEDKQGIPFVGRAGQLLTKMIEAMGLSRDDVYISNVVKCRPPSNRVPLPDEMDACTQHILWKEIALIQPKIICALGSTAAKAMLGQDIKISKIRGIFQKADCIDIMPTYHPAYLLRNPEAKVSVWEDLKKIMSKIQPQG
ncbi:uracil-DNA glycosylase [bacterium]|jgi:uracil-DNA glycosylase|nr:uracil-DNA glycosylase [bacterium]